MTDFINKTKLEFIDIATERYREYTFPNGIVVRIDRPLKLNVSASGGHRLFDTDDKSHYVAPGWVKLTWESWPGCAHFVA